jgi:Domain of unknown function (DUF4426)
VTKWCVLAALLLTSTSIHAEQKVVFEDVEIHYIVLPTTSLAPEIAEQYQLERAPRRGFVNVSILAALPPFEALSGVVEVEVRNLLGQSNHLAMREINEPPARYYLGTFDYSDEETMRLTIRVTLPDGRSHLIEHSQKMYNEE